MNQVQLVGHLVADAKTFKSKKGTNTAVFRVAVNVAKDKAIFMDCWTSEKLVPITEKYCKKGQLVGVSGQLMQTTKLYSVNLEENKKKVVKDLNFTTTMILVDSLDLLGIRKDEMDKVDVEIPE